MTEREFDKEISHCLSLSPSLSLAFSLSLYIYICVCPRVYVCKYVCDVYILYTYLSTGIDRWIDR